MPSEPLTSAQNPKIKLVRALMGKPAQRNSENAFIAEGVRLVEEAAKSPATLRFVLYAPQNTPRTDALIATLMEHKVDVIRVSESLLQSLSDTETTQGILAVCDIPTPVFDAQASFMLIADGIRDPGNLGTILRTAEAAAVQAVILAPGTVDAFNPKVVRAAMGAHFRLPIFNMTWQQIMQHTQPLRKFLAESSTGIPLWQADFRQPMALIIGSEASGGSAEARAQADQHVHIPMPGAAESLNAGMAAGILLFEVVRQRQHQE